jgi:hypothetical protein
MPFTADLNPKGGKSMDLLDMIKLESYFGGKTAKPAAKPNNMVKSSADDKGVEFKFNTNQDANNTTG